ncbi:MAG: hypothetical protein O2971_17440 [Proteobacteria bacterium]|nr:hypothetical protein [Pseudomonadota bacterium]
MQFKIKLITAVLFGLLTAAALTVQAQSTDNARFLSLSPPGGLPIIPVMEGWIAEPDGTTSFSFGIINRNDASVDIPVGENNYITPAKYNGMQPTHFPAGRSTGAFAVNVPESEADDDVWWYIKTGNSQVLKVPGRRGASAYELDFILPRPQGSLQPLVGIGENGPQAAGIYAQIGDYPGGTVSANTAVVITVNVSDPAERDPTDPRFKETIPLGVKFTQFQGPGSVEFTRHETTPVPEAPEIPPGVPANFANRFRAPGPDTVNVDGPAGIANVYASFSEPGDYIIAAKVNVHRAPDSSDGDQCCWTNVYQRVTVR